MTSACTPTIVEAGRSLWLNRFFRAMPTVLVFESGAVRGQLVGARPKSAFVELLEQAR